MTRQKETMLLFKPISRQGHLPDYEGALPVPTYELCGDKGVYVAVGNRVLSLVYRGAFDVRTGHGSWHWVYMKEGDSCLQDAPAVLN